MSEPFIRKVTANEALKIAGFGDTSKGKSIAQQRIDLDVQYNEKDAVKALGAKWDVTAKVWYIPAGIDATPFQKWLPVLPAFHMRCGSFYVGSTPTKCWKCHGATYVHCIVLIEPEILSVEWKPCNYTISPYFIKEISSEALTHIRMITEKYQEAYSKQANGRYFINHCQVCDAKIGDFRMYNEPDGEFAIDDPAILDWIYFNKINHEIILACDGQVYTESKQLRLREKMLTATELLKNLMEISEVQKNK